MSQKTILIRIHQYGVKKFGIQQDDRYFETFFQYFNIIAERPFSFEAVDYIKVGYRRCVCGSDTIYYRLSSDAVIEIMTIIGKQDLESIL
ncbi:type II toxin-antitoxin system RelE/ParE family toxin [uncultured Dokdonia sp.]|uniref:type II toxin-antitoxin system RelE/ParE family toxin n=1 Tax=uncultured Dokdonia sp. TaxID=575653 RepID=UPI00262ED7F3|nr:type II toxin-antitoxin system RelE/ParE family toxin [uncultured Dokdonia sp.]